MAIMVAGVIAVAEEEATETIKEETTAPLVINELTTPVSEDIIEDIPVVEVEKEVEDQVADLDAYI